MSKWLFFLQPRFWDRVARAVFGEVRYSPPVWPMSVLDSMRKHPGRWALPIILGGTLYGVGTHAYQWWEAHKPRPKQVIEIRSLTAKLDPPGLSLFQEGKAVPGELELRFSKAAAPLDQIRKPNPTGIELSPKHAGAWTWESDTRLVFKPAADWPPGVDYTVTLDTTKLAKETKLDGDPVWNFTTPNIFVTWRDLKFYTNPSDPDEHLITAMLDFTHPVDIAALQRTIKTIPLSGKSVFTDPSKPFTLTADEDRPQHRFYFRSPRITLPAKEDFVSLELPAGLVGLNGGKPVEKPTADKVRVPDVYTGFTISDIATQLIRTSEGEPEQFIFVDTSGYARTEEIAKHVQAWYLPDDVVKYDVLNKQKIEIPLWTPDGDLNAAYAKEAKPLTLKPVETEKADKDAPLATRHGFKFLQEAPGRLLVRIEKGTQALGGFILARNARETLSVPDFPKEVELTGNGGILALNGERKVSVKSRGIKNLRVTLGRVPAAQVNHLAVFNEGTFENPELSGIGVENLAHVHREIVSVASRNEYQAAYTSFDFSAALAGADPADVDASRGMFFVRFEGVQKREEDDKDNEDADDPEPIIKEWKRVEGDTTADRFILVTDLGLIAKRNTDGTRDMFVQSVSKGEPVAGVALTVLSKNGEFVAQGTTDAQGHVQLPNVEVFRREKEACAITARIGNDLAFMPFKRGERKLQYSRFDVEGVLASEMETLEAFLFTERGIYRPGDAIHIAGIVRRRDWQGDLAEMPLEVVVFDAKQNELKRERLSLPKDGFFDWSTSTAESDPTGTYEVQLLRVLPDDKTERIGRTAFRVEDFQPDRTKIVTKLSAPPGLAWIQPKEVKGTVKLENLFGTAAANRRVVAQLDLSPASFHFDQYPDHTFHNRKAYEFKKGGDEDETRAGKKVDLGELKTNDDGIAEFDLNLERFDKGSFAMRFFAEGFEADGGRSVQSAQSTLVSSMPYVVGYKADGQLDYISKDSPRGLKLLCVAPDLNPVASPALKARLTRIRFVSVLTKQKSGSYAYVSTRRENIASEAPLTIPAAGLDFALPTGEAAEFRWELLDGDDIVCSVPFTVVGKGDPSRNMEHDAELELKLAKKNFNSGEMLEMSLNAPYKGAGLITIERDSVLAWQWFKNPTTASTQSILVPPGFEGTGYVNVTCVRALDSPEIFASPLSYAVQPFEANKGAHFLAVKLEGATLLRPGEPLHISYTTGEAGRIAIFAVDEGILQITNYKVPQPLNHFLQKRALETQTWQMLDLILPEFAMLAKNAAFGGDGDDELNVNLNPFKRRKDAPVVYWSGLVPCGPEKKEVTYTVPEYFDGKLRIMAVAVANNRIGTSEASTLVRSPLVLTPNAPTFAAPGDEFTVSLSVSNNLQMPNPPGEVSLTFAATEQLEILDPVQQTLAVAPGKEATTRIRVKARDSLGGAEITFTATAGGEEVKRRATLSVRPAAPYMTEVNSGYFRLAKQEVPLNRTVYPQFRKAEAVASALPLGLARGLEAYLADYPHGCSEQITSRAMSRLLLAGEVDFGFDQAESAKQIDMAMRLLEGRQNDDGGFGYWSGDATNAAHDFLSVYVTHFLTEAKEMGHAPPSDMMDAALEHMRTIARAPSGDADIQAAAIYLLTRNGEVTTNFVLNLRDSLEKNQKDTWRTSLAAAYLGSTYALLQQRPAGTAIMRAYWSNVDKKPFLARWYYGWFDDPQVKQSQGFALLCRHFPEIAKDIGYNELSMITDPIRENHFNTLSAANGIMALKAYSALVKKADLKLNIQSLPATGEPAMLLPDGNGMRRAKFDAGLKGLNFLLDKGTSDLGAYYQVTETGFDRAPVTKPVADSIEIVRELLTGDKKPAKELTVGEAATVRIRVRNNSPESLGNVAVLDLLPGGFLLVPNGLKPGRGTVPGTEYVDVREDRDVFFFSLGKAETLTIEYEIKPVCAGTFAVPPVFAECMYDRGVRGRGVTGSITVKQP